MTIPLLAGIARIKFNVPAEMTDRRVMEARGEPVPAAERTTRAYYRQRLVGKATGLCDGNPVSWFTVSMARDGGSDASKQP